MFRSSSCNQSCLQHFSFLSFILLIASCQQEKTNVVLILVDDLGWTDLKCYGSEFHETPNLDRLAQKSFVFTNAYSASPVCSPTRAALMTGKHPARINITDWIPGMSTERADSPTLITPEDLHNLPNEEETLAEAFQQAGYRTFFAGKWHLGEDSGSWPMAHGFDFNIGGNAWGSPGRFNSDRGYYSPYGNPQMSDGPEGEYLTDRLTDETLGFIEQNKQHPFFAFLSYYTVHTPIAGCDRYDEYFQQKKQGLPDSGAVQAEIEHQGLTRINQSNPKYAAMVKALDENIGKLMRTLDSLELSKNTVIIFTSDNGGLSTLRRPGPTSVRPLRAGKGWCYEGGIRVPLMVYWPAVEKRGEISEPVITMDIYPTLLDLCDLPLSSAQHKDGLSLKAILQHPDQTLDRSLIWHYPHYHGSTWRPGSAIRKGNWKLIFTYEDEQTELYDLGADIGERMDLIKLYKEEAVQLQRELESHLKTMGAKMPVIK